MDYFNGDGWPQDEYDWDEPGVLPDPIPEAVPLSDYFTYDYPTMTATISNLTATPELLADANSGTWAGIMRNYETPFRWSSITWR